jgi:hypothetical protein
MANAAGNRDHVTGLLKMFQRKQVDALVKHFAESINAFEDGDWEKCINKAGKFVEAVLKALAVHTSVQLPSAREFKVGQLVIKLGQLTPGQFDDSIRLLIPRNCVFIYDVASNRGSRHDSTDIDANKMDAIAVAQNVSWVLAEMIRLSHQGALHPDDAAEVVAGLMEKRYPDIEEIAGRIYVNRSGLSGRKVALLVMERRFPARIHRDELIATLRRNGIGNANALQALERTKHQVDDDGRGNLLLRANGRAEAAAIRAEGRL